MKKPSAVFSLISIITLLTVTVNAAENNTIPEHPGMPGFPGFPDFPSTSGFNSCFKIADLDVDGIPEIILLKDEALIVMDNKGNVLFSKIIEGINDDLIMNNPETEDNHLKPQHVRGMFGSVRLDVADLDMEADQFPEIVILDSEKLLVLDNTGKLKFTIPLPEIVIIQ